MRRSTIISSMNAVLMTVFLATILNTSFPLANAYANSDQLFPNTASETTPRHLQFVFDPLALANAATNTTCPEGCFLCECIDSQDPECLLQGSIKSCQEKTLAACYDNFMPPGSDIAGLCSSQCEEGGSGGEVLGQDFLRSVCRLCEIFTCCETCPEEKIPECFPSNLDEGYTPPDWEPATCGVESSAVNWVAGPITFLGFIVWGLLF